MWRKRSWGRIWSRHSWDCWWFPHTDRGCPWCFLARNHRNSPSSRTLRRPLLAEPDSGTRSPGHSPPPGHNGTQGSLTSRFCPRIRSREGPRLWPGSCLHVWTVKRGIFPSARLLGMFCPADLSQLPSPWCSWTFWEISECLGLAGLCPSQQWCDHILGWESLYLRANPSQEELTAFQRSDF